MKLHGNVIILADRSMLELQIDCTKLEPGSHKKIFVQCQKCTEVFIREYRHVNLFHKCPTRVIQNGITMRWCNKCHNFLTLGVFGNNANMRDGLSPYCRTCVQNSTKKRLAVDFDFWLTHLLASKKSYCLKHNIKYEISHEYMKSIWESQKGLCLYSLIPLSFNSRSLAAAWLERIDPLIGYVKGNVVWASKGMNTLKSDASFDDFKTYLERINYNHISPIRMEVKLLHEDAKMPFRKRVTDAGYDLSSIEDTIIPGHGVKEVHTGLIVAAPPGYYMTIDGRSSMSQKGIMPFRGIIDATYCGELMIALENISNSDYQVKKFDRIAQLICHEQIHMDFSVVNEFGPDYNQRGTAGFGESGR